MRTFGRLRWRRRTPIHKGLSAWPLAGALLLPIGLVGWVAAAVYVHAWARGIRITRWKWIGSWGIVTLSALAAAGMFRVVNGAQLLPGTGSGKVFAAVLATMATFLVTETAGFFVISRINDPSDEEYLRAQLASPSFYVVEVAVLGSGALTGPSATAATRSTRRRPAATRHRYPPAKGS